MKLSLEIMFKELYRYLSEKRYRKFIQLARKFGSKPRFEEKKIEVSGYKLVVPDLLSFIWQYKEIFVDENYKFNSSTEKPIIYDCGANIGISILYFKWLFPKSRIKAFEPDPNIFNRLEQNIKTNRITEIELISAAVWINNNGIEFGIEGADGSSIYHDGKKVKVNSVRLKELLEKEEKIDLLKIDIEGAETEVLIDCDNSFQNVENLFIEYHSFTKENQRLAEILFILTKNGFRYFIKQEADRITPFINRVVRSNPKMDMQLNIFAYKTE